MKGHSLILLLAAVLLLAGCATGYRPPSFPVAYMVPTMVSGQQLRDLPRLEVAPDEVVRVLRDAGLWEELARLGMPMPEVRTLCRGLANYGYGEIDAHRCPGSALDRIVLVATPSGGLRLVVRRMGDGDGPLEVRDYPTNGRPLPRRSSPAGNLP